MRNLCVFLGRKLRTVETALIRDVVHEEDAHGASVVCGGDCPEAFLTCRVPYLQLHSLAVQLDGSDFKVDADGGDEGWGEGVFAKAQQTA